MEIFTLLETLAVFIILGIVLGIVSIAFIYVNNTIKKAYYQGVEETLFTAGGEYYTYNKNEGVQRNVDKCLRCSVCYQTCPFDVVRYYHVRFLIEDEIIVITVQTSQLARN